MWSANIVRLLVVNDAIQAITSNLTMFADHMTLNAALNVGAGTVYLDTWALFEPINLGAKSPTTLGLLQTDLNQITTSRLQIGDASLDTGGMTISAPLAAPAGWSTLDLRQNAGITE